MNPKQRISYFPVEEMDAEMQKEMDRCRREGTPRPDTRRFGATLMNARPITAATAASSSTKSTRLCTTRAPCAVASAITLDSAVDRFTSLAPPQGH